MLLSAALLLVIMMLHRVNGVVVHWDMNDMRLNDDWIAVENESGNYAIWSS